MVVGNLNYATKLQAGPYSHSYALRDTVPKILQAKYKVLRTKLQVANKKPYRAIYEYIICLES